METKPISTSPDAITVAVVDDDQLSREFAAFALSDDHVSVRCFSSGEALLEAASRGSLDCILLDVGMPGITGLEVQARLNAMGVHAPVIMFSADEESSTAMQAIYQGATDYVTKPVDPRALRNRVMEAVHCRKAA